MTILLFRPSWVLEPEPEQEGGAASYAWNYRRIFLEKHVSAVVTFPDPLGAIDLRRGNPALAFVGPAQRVQSLQARAEEYREGGGGGERGLAQQLEDLLGFPLPRRDGKGSEDAVGMCGICYTHKLHGKAPAVACENPKCDQLFHSSCLQEWLQSNRTSRQTFGVQYGACPYCDATVVCKLAG